MGCLLFNNKLAACTNILPSIYSTYIWNNKVQNDKEYSMIVKTSKSKVKKAIQFIVKHHSYDCPAVSAFPIKFTHKDFQKWIITQTRD
jgi:periplasmic divalent cation tolerance protein